MSVPPAKRLLLLHALKKLDELSALDNRLELEGQRGSVEEREAHQSVRVVRLVHGEALILAVEYAWPEDQFRRLCGPLLPLGDHLLVQLGVLLSIVIAELPKCNELHAYLSRRTR